MTQTTVTGAPAEVSDSSHASEWPGVLAALPANVPVSIAMVQAKPHWVATEFLETSRLIEHALATAVLNHRASIRVVRLVGGVEGNARHEWIRGISAWSRLKPRAVESYHLFTPNSDHADRLCIMPYSDYAAFHSVRDWIIEQTDGNRVNPEEHTSLVSFHDRYPITGSL